MEANLIKYSTASTCTEIPRGHYGTTHTDFFVFWGGVISVGALIIVQLKIDRKGGWRQAMTCSKGPQVGFEH